MENIRVLIVDDDCNVLESLSKSISSCGMNYDTASSGEEALEKTLVETYDTILMDINMSGISGFEAIAALRERHNETPIIIVSGRKEDSDTVYGIDVGADDYVTKPFNPVVLGAKIKALVRRNKKDEDHIIVAGPFRYDTSTLRLYKNDVEIELSGKENALIKLFLDSINRVFTKEALYELIWNNILVDKQTITVYINRLRAKIEDNPAKPKYIKTVRGIGYRFDVWQIEK